MLATPGAYVLIVRCYTARYALGTDPHAHIENAMTDTGFVDVKARRLGDPATELVGMLAKDIYPFPEWAAEVRARWPHPTREIQDAVGDIRIDHHIALGIPGGGSSTWGPAPLAETPSEAASSPSSPPFAREVLLTLGAVGVSALLSHWLRSRRDARIREFSNPDDDDPQDEGGKVDPYAATRGGSAAQLAGARRLVEDTIREFVQKYDGRPFFAKTRGPYHVMHFPAERVSVTQGGFIGRVGEWVVQAFMPAKMGGSVDTSTHPTYAAAVRFAVHHRHANLFDLQWLNGTTSADEEIAKREAAAAEKRDLARIAESVRHLHAENFRSQARGRAFRARIKRKSGGGFVLQVRPCLDPPGWWETVETRSRPGQFEDRVTVHRHATWDRAIDWIMHDGPWFPWWEVEFDNPCDCPRPRRRARARTRPRVSHAR